jgi:pyruvate dehydrogenase E2 component (dihydrolipoamide acetyltransferase)
MATSVTLPALGESVTEGTVTRWLKQPGDEVQADEPLLEVSTDKVDTEIPSPVAGTLLEIKVDEDETVEVGAELAVIGDSGEAPAADAAPEADDAEAAEPEAEAPEAEAPEAEAPAAESAEEPESGEDEPLLTPAEGEPDVEGAILALVRRHIGAGVPHVAPRGPAGNGTQKIGE